jgi:hypothetical protein
VHRLSDLDAALLGLWLTVVAWTVWAAVLTYWLAVWPRQRQARQQQEDERAPRMVPASTLVVPDAEWIADVNRINGGPWPIYYFSTHLGRHRAGPESPSSVPDVLLVAVSSDE